ncbi:phenylalanine--tRNA ligase subunit beta, partial [Escherichia coli]
EGWQVTAPSRRFDIAIEEDLIEELARIHGYEQIPTTLPGGASRVAMPSETQLDALSVRRQLIARDQQETVNFAFVDDALLTQWQLRDGLVPLAN